MSASENPFELGTDGPATIVAAIDGSLTSLRAAAYAGGLARRQGSRLLAIYVESVGTLAGVSAAGVVASREATEATAEDLRRLVELARQRGVELTLTTRTGDPYTEITRFAEEVRADALVVGASEHLGHRLVGSLAVRLVRAGRWPVTVVP
ncbi:universal stress protein [Kitasatospora sp. MAP5-34]|uniref:universal stress protein n=1 Tax=Kitasatospora sp. MAP5-34 TaxID=3035102 RepID=UPI002474669F|nr:universal stress protein [Kitasatospora sp. MAP5-34]MDH6575205.1 nucleotide-binding universal stress UspA family protein [Kitasatospora sp. MAP5-34]